MIIQDVDHNPNQGALLSDVRAEILRALDCQAVVTNGTVRDLPALAAMNFPAFCQFVSASNAYMHTSQVEILGLHVAPGDLVYVDVRGAVLLPEGSIEEICRVRLRPA